MKYFLFYIIVCMFHITTFATTVNYNWFVDGTSYAQTTCETGDDLILPSPTPTKYGYHFVGWREKTVYGSWSQSGIPSPTNPIEPVFKPFRNTVLRAVGSGTDLIADSYNPETRTITRRIGIKVFDGTEVWGDYATANGYNLAISDMASQNYGVGLCSHFDRITSVWVQGTRFGANNSTIYVCQVKSKYSDVTAFKQFLTDQYAAGTPVTIYYPLETPIEENLE